MYLEEKKTSIKSMIIHDMPNVPHIKNAMIGNLLEDPTDRNIVRLKYLDGHTWEKICVILNYSWNGIHKKHRKILEKIG